jgi:hypothetical protein
MKKLLTYLTILISISSFGQNPKTDFLKDLDFVYENLKNTASYKTQKKTHSNVDLKYNELRNRYSSTDVSVIKSFIGLYELVDEINDYHNDIYGNSESFSYDDLKDDDFVSKIKKSSNYNFYPKTKMNLDSLETELSKREKNDYEGIYYYQTFFKIGVVKRHDNMLEGIVLETKIPSWERGETIFYLLSKNDNRFRMLGGTFVDKKLFSSIDCFVNGEFKAYCWQKQVPEISHYNANFPDQKFLFKNLNNAFTYIKLGSFGSSNKGIKEATDFNNEISGKITTRNLIVDLRNNSGGGDKSSTQFYKLFKKFKGNIYVLVNFYTVSNAEQFVIKMKKNKNVIVLGDNTKGKVTYGRNYPEDKETPSKNFKIYFTDLKDNWKRYLKYEGVGIKPDFYLNSDKDWIEQTIEKYSQ